MPSDNSETAAFGDRPALDAIAAAAIGTDRDGVVVRWNAAAEQLYGWTQDEAVGRHIIDLTPAARAEGDAGDVFGQVLAGESWVGEFPVRRKDGTTFLARVQLQPVLDDEGAVIGVVGLSEDISEWRFQQVRSLQNEERLRLALEAGGLGAWEWDVGTGRVVWDERLEEIFGYAAGTFPGTYDAWLEALHPDDREHVLGSVQQAVALQSRNRMEHRIVRRDGQVRWIESHSQPVLADDGSVRGTIGCVRDITEMKRAELERQRLRAHEQFLLDAGERLASSLEVDETLTIIADVTVPALADWCVVHLLDDGAVRLGLLRHRNAEGERRLARLVESAPARLDAPEGVGKVLRTGVAELIPVLREADVAAAGEIGDVRARAIAELQLRSLAIVPLTARGRVVGAVTVGREREQPLTPDDQALVAQLGARAALALDNALAYARERRAAVTLQHSLLPETDIRMPGLTVASRYLAGAAGTEVGGDWYDAVSLPGGKVGISVGDVMGRGLAAAAVMGQVRAALRGCGAAGDDPGTVLGRLDGVVATFSSTQLVTCAYGVFDPATRELLLASAGHLPPLLVPPSGDPAYLTLDPGTPLGVSAGAAAFPVTRLTLEPGSLLLLFTDGLVEHRERSLDDGLRQLRASVRAADDLDALCDELLSRMHAGLAADDDTALVVLRVT